MIRTHYKRPTVTVTLPRLLREVHRQSLAKHVSSPSLGAVYTTSAPITNWRARCASRAPMSSNQLASGTRRASTAMRISRFGLTYPPGPHVQCLSRRSPVALMRLLAAGSEPDSVRFQRRRESTSATPITCMSDPHSLCEDRSRCRECAASRARTLHTLCPSATHFPQKQASVSVPVMVTAILSTATALEFWMPMYALAPGATTIFS